jgi:hypothetical protein
MVLAAPVVLSEFVLVANRNSGVSLEERLRESGWIEGQPGSGGLHRQWQKGDIVAIQFGDGSDAMLEVTLQITWPDLDDPESEDRLEAEYETRFEQDLAQSSQVIGQPAFVGSYGDRGFPDDVDAVTTALWPQGSGAVALNFKYEDSGVPLRITATVR